MRSTSLLTLATAFVAFSAIPAFAQWDRIGSVQVGPGPDQDRIHGRFGGPIERLQLDADRSDVYCRSVRVTFGNGRTRQVFSGRLR